MPKRTGKKDQVLLKLEGELKTRFELLRNYYGIEGNADLVRALINERYNQLKQLGVEILPLLEHFNLDENGVRILDRSLATPKSRGRIIDVYFKSGKCWCDYCQSKSCNHIKFALEIPEVLNIFHKKGWKLPEV